MEVSIKKEQPAQYADIDMLLQNAFPTPGEAKLVQALRQSNTYIHELSLAAQVDGLVVGHIMFTALELKGDGVQNLRALSLAPLAVQPQFQRKGIGSRMVAYGLAQARDLGYDCVFVLGSDEYYPRFGFRPSVEFGVTSPFDVPQQNYMAVQLKPSVLEGVRATTLYPPEFSEV